MSACCDPRLQPLSTWPSLYCTTKACILRRAQVVFATIGRFTCICRLPDSTHAEVSSNPQWHRRSRLFSKLIVPPCSDNYISDYLQYAKKHRCMHIYVHPESVLSKQTGKQLHANVNLSFCSEALL